MKYNGLNEPTIATSVKVHNGAYADIDDTQEALILLLELLLVKYLNRQGRSLRSLACLVY